MIAVCLNYAWKKKSRFLKKSCIFTIWLIWPRPNTKLLPWGSWNLQFLVSLPYKCYIPNLVKIGPVVLEKMLIHDSQQTPTHSNSPSQSELLTLYFSSLYAALRQSEGFGAVFKQFEAVIITAFIKTAN